MKTNLSLSVCSFPAEGRNIPHQYVIHALDPTLNPLVCQCIKHFPDVVSECEFWGGSLANQGDGGVLQRTEGADDSVEAKSRLVLQEPRDRLSNE